jgi:acyl-CoA synthetase (NDP forming)
VTTDLSVFSDPRSVAVVGASADPAKWGYWLARGALRGRHRRAVHLVNARGAEIDGVPAHRSLADLPEPPELVVLCTPAAHVPAVVDEALELGATGFLGITAGIDAAHGEPGLERRLADRIRAAGARLVGPNCLGLYDAASELELAWGTFHPGELGIVSQSGQLGLEIASLAHHAGLGVARFLSLGNQVDVTAVDALRDLVDHPATKAVVLYLESFVSGRELLAAVGELRAAGKPVVVLTVGASEASRVAARSHTGALTASTDVVAAACRAAGAVLVDTPAEAVDLAHLLLGSPLPTGRRIAVVSDSGGQGALAADTLSREGLTVPRLEPATSDALAAILPAAAAVANPVDLAGAGEQDLDSYSRVVDLLLRSGEVDGVVLSGYFGAYGSDAPELQGRELEVIDKLAGSVREHGRPVVVHSMTHDSLSVQTLRANAVPTLLTIDAVARSLSLAAQLREATARADAALDADVPRSDGAGGAGRSPVALTYGDARVLLGDTGVAFPPARPVGSPDDLQEAARTLRAPYVLKAGWIEHKTEVGGIAVGLPDVTAAAAAYGDMVDRLGPGPYVLEELDTRRDAVEIIVGCRRDPSFGPVVLVGAGGVEAELHRDLQLALAPVARGEALDLVRRLRAHRLLAGWRGRPATDVDALADLVVTVSRLLVDHPEVAECELNPVRVAPAGVLAVDALVLTTAEAPSHPVRLAPEHPTELTGVLP